MKSIKRTDVENFKTKIRNLLTVFVIILLGITVMSSAKKPVETLNEHFVPADTELYLLLEKLTKTAKNSYSEKQLNYAETSCAPFKTPANRLINLVFEEKAKFVVNGFGNLALDAYIEIFSIGGFSKAKKILEIIKKIKDYKNLGNTAKAELKKKLENEIKERLKKKYGENKAAKEAEKLVNNLIKKFSGAAPAPFKLKSGPRKNNLGCTETLNVNVDWTTLTVDMSLTAKCDCNGKNAKSPLNYSAEVKGRLLVNTANKKSKFSGIKLIKARYSGRCCNASALNDKIAKFEALTDRQRGLLKKEEKLAGGNDEPGYDCTNIDCNQLIKSLLENEKKINSFPKGQASKKDIEAYSNFQSAILEAYKICECDKKLNGIVPEAFKEIFKRTKNRDGVTYVPKDKQSIGPIKEFYSIDPNADGFENQNSGSATPFQRPALEQPKKAAEPGLENRPLQFNPIRQDQQCMCYKSTNCSSNNQTDYIGLKNSLMECQSAGGRSARMVKDNQCVSLFQRPEPTIQNRVILPGQ